MVVVGGLKELIASQRLAVIRGMISPWYYRTCVVLLCMLWWTTTILSGKFDFLQSHIAGHVNGDSVFRWSEGKLLQWSFNSLDMIQLRMHISLNYRCCSWKHPRLEMNSFLRSHRKSFSWYRLPLFSRWLWFICWRLVHPSWSAYTMLTWSWLWAIRFMYSLFGGWRPIFLWGSLELFGWQWFCICIDTAMSMGCLRMHRGSVTWTGTACIVSTDLSPVCVLYQWYFMMSVWFSCTVTTLQSSSSAVLMHSDPGCMWCSSRLWAWINGLTETVLLQTGFLPMQFRHFHRLQSGRYWLPGFWYCWMLESWCLSHTFEAFRFALDHGDWFLQFGAAWHWSRTVGWYLLHCVNLITALRATRFLSIDGYLLTSLLLMAQVFHRHCDLCSERDQSFAAIRLNDVYRRDFSLSFWHF